MPFRVLHVHMERPRSGSGGSDSCPTMMPQPALQEKGWPP